MPELAIEDANSTLNQPPLESEYRFQTGDELEVRSYYDVQLKQKLVIRTDGKVSFLLIGDYDAVGKTPKEIEKHISMIYKRMVNVPEVTVVLTRSAGLNVYVGGEVKNPSTLQLDGSLTVLQAITRVGGILPSAHPSQLILLRYQEFEKVHIHKIDLDGMLSNRTPDVYLRRRDVLYAPKSVIANLGSYVDQHFNEIFPSDIITSCTACAWLNDRSAVPAIEA